ncbi:MAG: O-antigen ligase family protein [Candidatus Eremiobacteraeota bacterium]|nr:O-antigen ligase family protein [Candidatus Eremiobacteraeota bacterium]
MLAILPNRHRVVRFVAIGLALYVLFSFAAYVADGSLPHAALTATLGFIPIAVYVALRWPMVFPFGLYVALVPVEALLLTGGNSGATVAKYGAILLGAAFLARVITARRALVPPRAWWAWAAFTLFAVASLAWSVYQPETFATLLMLLQLFALYTVASIYPIAPLEALAMRRVVEGASVVVACYGIYAYMAGQQLQQGRLSLSEGKQHIDPNHYAAYFAIPIALLLARFLTEQRLSRRIISAGALALCALNIFFTGSRGVFVAIAAALVYLAIRTRKYGMTAAMCAGLVAISFVVPNTWQRFLDPSQGDASGRTDIWTVALHAFPHFWLAGSGFATFQVVYDQYLLGSYQHSFAGFTRPSHNVFIGTSVELGIIGLVLVLVAWFLSVRQTWNVPRDHPAAPVAYGAEAACVALFVCALSLDMLWFKYLWLALMLVVLTSNAVRARTLWAAPGHARAAKPLPTKSTAYAAAGKPAAKSPPPPTVRRTAKRIS